MKDLKAINFKTVEFWAATTIFVVAVFMHITGALGANWNVTYNYSGGIVSYRYLFIATLCRYAIFYISFLALNFIAVPRLLRRQAVAGNMFLIILVFAFVGFGLGAID